MAKTVMGVFYFLLLSGLIVGVLTGMSKEMELAMIIAGSCGPGNCERGGGRKGIKGPEEVGESSG